MDSFIAALKVGETGKVFGVDMTDEQRNELPKNVITRALGMQDNVEVDMVGDDAHVGDVYVLCSDGLSGMVDDQDILQVVQDYQTPEAICKRLVTMANEHGGEDNVTAVVISVVEGGRSDLEYARTQQIPAK